MTAKYHRRGQCNERPGGRSGVYCSRKPGHKGDHSWAAGLCRHHGPVGMLCQVRKDHTGRHEFRKADGQAKPYYWDNLVGNPIPAKYDQDKLAQAIACKIPKGARLGIDTSCGLAAIYNKQGKQLGAWIATMTLQECERGAPDRSSRTNRLAEHAEPYVPNPMNIDPNMLKRRYGITEVERNDLSHCTNFKVHHKNENLLTQVTTIRDEEIAHCHSDTEVIAQVYKLLDKRIGANVIHESEAEAAFGDPTPPDRFEADDTDFAARRRKKRQEAM